ncbi:MAG: VWA domain-containing protein, partial [Sedimentisphaerales bacterium]|nr:VWA domain-containing protein [Sedimentisphaerales bacterium]
DYRHYGRPQGGDLAIASVDAPQRVTPGENYMINARIWCSEAVIANYQLIRGNFVVARGNRQLQAGDNVLTFRDRSGAAGSYSYELLIEGLEQDSIKQNNQAKFIVSVQGNKPLLALSQSDNSGLVRLLQNDGINLDNRRPSEMSFSLDELAGYSAILLEDVSANDIGSVGMENIAAWVTQTGAGLLMTGGPRSFGPGGYFRSPIEPIMPVSMELRREHRKLNMAIVLVLDRSGSMAMTVQGGQTKMDLADAASAEVLGMMTEYDELGVIAVDSSSHIIIPCAPIGNDTSALCQKILSIDSMGGGIFVYEGLSAAASELVNAQSQTKHIILFADAADSEEPGDYINLLEKCQAAGVTVSVIGLGTETDSDAELLKDIALRGQGRCFFTTDAFDLPRLFAQDTFMVARSSFIEDTTPFEFTVGLNTIMDLPGVVSTKGSIGGYNLCYLRPTAQQGMVTSDEYAAPLLANWQAGLGRVAAYCGQADGNYAGPMAQWSQAGKFYSSLVRWIIGDSGELGTEIVARQKMRDGICQVILDINPEAREILFSELPTVNIVREQSGSAPEMFTLPLRYAGVDKLTTDIPLIGDSVVLATIDAGPRGRVNLPAMCGIYSPEYKPAAGDGRQYLQRLADMTGGRQLTDLAKIWEQIPERPVLVDLTPWLAVAATVVFLLEILQRRSGVPAYVAGWLVARLRRTHQVKIAVDKTTTVETVEQDEVPADQARVSRPGILSSLPRIRRNMSGRTPADHVGPDPVATLVQEPKNKNQPTLSDQPTTTEGDLLNALNKARKNKR